MPSPDEGVAPVSTNFGIDSMDYDLGDSLQDGPGCGTAWIVGDATGANSLGRSVVRHHLPQLLEEVGGREGTHVSMHR